MRVLALNLLHGGGARIPSLIDYLEAQAPHTLLLSEWHDSAKGARIAEWARARGMQVAGLCDGMSRNGVMIASRSRFVSASMTPAIPAAGVLMVARFADYSLLGCYFPVRIMKAAFFVKCGEMADACAGTPLLMMGDLNTGNQIADKDPGGAPYHHATEFDRLTTAHGLIDLWRRTHGDAARESTWLSQARNGFRLDHAFGNDAFARWADPVCRYDHETRTRRLTDHSAVIVDCSGRAGQG